MVIEANTALFATEINIPCPQVMHFALKSLRPSLKQGYFQGCELELERTRSFCRTRT